MPQTALKPCHRINLPIQTRLAQLELPQGEQETDNVFDIVWTTGARVRRYDWMNDEVYDEELVVTPEAVRMERLNSGSVAVLNTHSQYSLEDVIGVFLANTGVLENGQGLGRIMIDTGEATKAVLTKIQNRIIRNVSVGYRVHRYEIIRSEGAVPLYRAVDWEPYEISLVPIGADAGAGIRSNPRSYPCEITQPQPKENRTMPDNDINQDPNTPENPPANPPANPAENPQPENPAPASNPPADNPAADPDDPPPAPEPSGEGQAEGVRMERSRVLEIQKIVRAAKLPEAHAIRMINDGTSVKRARKAVLDELARRSGEGGEIRSQVTITRDEMDSCRAVVENALLNRFNPDKYKLDSGAREFRGMSLLEIGRDMLERRGTRTRGFSRVQLAGAVLGLESRGGLQGTSDFPYILANVANKTLRDAYEAAPQTFKPFCRQTIAPDFKMLARVQLGDAPTLEKVNESGEFKRGSVSDAREQYALATYGNPCKQNTNAGTLLNRSEKPHSLTKHPFLKPKDMVGIPWRAAFALQADGWYLRSEIIWHKLNPMPESVEDRPTTAHERIFLLSKQPRYYFDQEAIKEDAITDEDRPSGIARDRMYDYDSKEKALRPSKRRGEFAGKTQAMQGREAFRAVVEKRNKRTVWEVASQPFTGAHFAVYPPKLIEPCILAGCPKGGTVLDPFFGAGTTGLVADRLQRHCIGIEINPEYAGIAERRIADEAGMFHDVRRETPSQTTAESYAQHP